MQDLGTLPGQPYSIAYAINNNGQAVGLSTDSAGNSHAFLWQNGVMQALGTLPGDAASEATGINDNGQVVGWSTDSTGNEYALLWLPGGAGGAIVSLSLGAVTTGQTITVTAYAPGATSVRLSFSVPGAIIPSINMTSNGNNTWTATFKTAFLAATSATSVLVTATAPRPPARFSPARLLFISVAHPRRLAQAGLSLLYGTPTTRMT